MFSILHSHSAAGARPRPKLRPRLPVPTEAEVLREIGTVLAATLAIAFAVNFALAAFGVD